MQSKGAVPRQTPPDEPDQDVNSHITRISSVLKLPANVTEFATRMYGRVITEEPDFLSVRTAMKKTDLSFPYNGDSDEEWPKSAVGAVMVYISCRENDIVVLLVDMEDASKQPLDVLARVYFQLCRILHLSEGLRDPSLFFGVYASRLDLGDLCYSVARTGLRVLQRLNRQELFSRKNKRPTGLMGAVLLLSSRLHGFVRSQQEIMRVIQNADVALRYTKPIYHDIIQRTCIFLSRMPWTGGENAGASAVSDIEKGLDKSTAQDEGELQSQILSGLKSEKVTTAVRSVLLHRYSHRHIKPQNSGVKDVGDDDTARKTAVRLLLTQFAPLLDDRPWKYVNAEDLEDADDEEVRQSILTPAEIAVKTKIWEKLNENSVVGRPAGRGRGRGRGGRAVLPSAGIVVDRSKMTPADAIASSLLGSNPSEKVNYQVLATLFEPVRSKPSPPPPTRRGRGRGGGKGKPPLLIGGHTDGLGLSVDPDRLGPSLGVTSKPRIAPKIPGTTRRRKRATQPARQVSFEMPEQAEAKPEPEAKKARIIPAKVRLGGLRGRRRGR